MKQRLASAVAMFVLWSTVCSAQSQPSAYDKAWRFTDWYTNEQNPAVQSVRFTGRFQYEFSNVDGEQRSHHEWNVRRLRLGAKSKVFRTITVHGEVELNPQERDPLYVRFTDLYVQWSKTARLKLTVGKQGVPFTLEGGTSSKELLTIDRSNLSNNMWFPQEYAPGVNLAGQVSNWIYQAGVYSSGQANREFGEFNGGAFTLAAAGYDFADSLGVDQALLTGNYVYQNPDANNTFTRRLQHVVSGNFKLDAPRWGLRADLSAASGYLGQSDLWGVMTLPFVNVTERFQVVGRHTFLKSDAPNGLLLATYENRVVPGRGDRYHEGYVGANYYFYGHKLKLQSGLQFGNMKDGANDGGTYTGVSFTSGLRVSW